MGNLLTIITAQHEKTARDYLARMQASKVECMSIAKKYGQRFWDGDRQYGYGGYNYDGRWKPVAEKLIAHYGLGPEARILDVGCGKGYLLYEIKTLLPRAQTEGIDISRYAVANAKPEIRDCLAVREAQADYPWNDHHFDLVLSLTTLHNLEVFDLKAALGEISRVGRNAYITVESFRNDQELFNLQCWALTCQSFYSPAAWKWLFQTFGYTGDYEFIYFS
jgi:ubiquinone/menaquinone biosynthesis C-methylase UbiE